MRKPVAVILYSEVMGYTMACLQYLVNHFEVDVYVVSWDHSRKISPYEAPNIIGLTMVYKSEFQSSGQILKYVLNKKPDVLFVSGWMDKDYVKVTKKIHQQNIPVITFIDNQWRGTWRQQMARFFLNRQLTDRYKYVWVSGARQQEYATKLGFSQDSIRLGFYSADVPYFNTVYRKRMDRISQVGYPQRITFVGRLVQQKGVDMLIRVFLQHIDFFKDWKLTIIGQGVLKQRLIDMSGSHPAIEFLDFMSAESMGEVMIHTGIFCLPSRFEPWGVVVHEFAAAGLPLILSSAVGAGDHFLVEGENGYIHAIDNQDSLWRAFDRLIQQLPEKWQAMGHRSHELAQQITPESWANTFMELTTRHSDK